MVYKYPPVILKLHQQAQPRRGTVKIKPTTSQGLKWVQAYDYEYIARVNNGETFHIRKDNRTGWWKLYWQFETEDHGWIQDYITHGDFREMVEQADQIVQYSN